MIQTFLKIIFIYYACINTLLFIFMGIDKSKARRNKWRIPESTLFMLSFIGGALGGIMGMQIFRHKTKKISFRAVFLISLVIHAVLLVLLYKYLTSSDFFSIMIIK